MNELITKNRNESKAIVKNLSESARVECDKVFALSADISKASQTVNTAMRTFEPQLCDSFSKISADKDGIKKAGFDSFKDFAAAAFGISDKAASMYKRVGDKFFNVEKRPTVSDWYTASKLQELRNVDNSKLDEDAKNGVLRPDMTMAELRAYAAKPALEDGKTEIAKTYDVLGYDGAEGQNLTESEIVSIPNDGVLPDDDRVHIFKSADKLVIPAADNKHKDREKPIYIACIECDDGECRCIKYVEHEKPKKTKKPGTIPPAFNDAKLAAMRAAGLTDDQIAAIINA